MGKFTFVSGTCCLLEALYEKFLTKANVIQMGLDNTTSESFIQGLTFKKQDNYSSQGSIIINRVGLLSFPFGQFIDNKTYAPITNTKMLIQNANLP